MTRDRFLGFRITPITRRRLHYFRANGRGFWSLWLFLVLFTLSLFAEFIANDKPLLIRFDGHTYLPIFAAYPETTFGGEFQTETDPVNDAVDEDADGKTERQHQYRRPGNTGNFQ